MDDCRMKIRLELLISTKSAADRDAIIGRLPQFTKVMREFDDFSIVVSTYRHFAVEHLCRELSLACGVVHYGRPPEYLPMEVQVRYLERLCGETQARRRSRSIR